MPSFQLIEGGILIESKTAFGRTKSRLRWGNGFHKASVREESESTPQIMRDMA